jgi:hypothetical protein
MQDCAHTMRVPEVLIIGKTGIGTLTGKLSRFFATGKDFQKSRKYADILP